MTWSSFHRGDYKHMRRSLTAALLEAEAMEPRVQLAFSQDLVPAELAATMSLVRLLLQRADRLTRGALDVSIADTGTHFDVYSDSTFSDRKLADAQAEGAR